MNEENAQQELWWLLEMPNYGHPLYWTGEDREGSDWTTDPWKAVRFPTQRAAQNVYVQMALYKDHISKILPVEHAFIRATIRNPAATPSNEG